MSEQSNIFKAPPMEKILNAAREEKISVLAFMPGKAHSSDGTNFTLSEALLLGLPQQAKNAGAEKIQLYFREELTCPEEETSLMNWLSHCRETGIELYLCFAGVLWKKELLQHLVQQHTALTFVCEKENAGNLFALLQDVVEKEQRSRIRIAFTPRKGEVDFTIRQAEILQKLGFDTTLQCMTFPGMLPEEKVLPSGEERRLLTEFFAMDPYCCVKPLYSCFADQDAKVYPCIGKGFPLGDLREKSLSDILLESKFLELLRQHPKRIKEPCYSCPQILQCCGGCRVRAYRSTGDYLASDEFCQRNADKKHLIHALPLSAKGLLPHAGRMELIDRILYLSEDKSIHEARVREDNPFLNEQGLLARAALPEYAAQACAVRDSVEKGGKPSPGLLSEIKNCTFSDVPVHAGDTLYITVRTQFHMDIWYGIAFRIENNDHLLAAEGVLKICIYDETPAPY